MFQKLCSVGYKIALAVLGIYAIYCYGMGGWSAVLHGPAYYVPIAAMFLMFSGQADLLAKIREGANVDIKARAIDFVHWFLLIFMAVGRWMADGITIWTFILTLVLLAIIGWQIGSGVGRQWLPSIGEKVGGVIMLVASALFGFFAGMIRYADATPLGWGWMLETFTAVIATAIVLWWITNDMRKIVTDPSGYPRSFFLKGVFNNALEIWVLIHLLTSYSGSLGGAFMLNAGIAFNIIVGNAIYLAFYLLWEKSNRKHAFSKVASI